MTRPLSPQDVALSARPSPIGARPQPLELRCPVSGHVVGEWRGPILIQDPTIHTPKR